MPKNRAGTSLNNALGFQNVPGKNVLKDWVGRGNNSDFYTFSLNKSSNVKLNLGKLKSDLDLELVDFQGNRVALSSRSNAKKEKIRTNLDAGTYYVKVSRQKGASSYKLKAVLNELDDSTLPPALDPTSTELVEDEATKATRTTFINEVLALTNVERTSRGLSSLTLNLQLNNSAQMQSQDLAFGDFFAHTSPTGTTLANRLDAAGYNSYQTAGENIAAGQTTAAQVVQDWMNSPGHRANILDSEFTQLGVGYYFLENDTGNVNYNHYWTQNFGTPMQ